jgi:hypothetical protein
MADTNIIILKSVVMRDKLTLSNTSAIAIPRLNKKVAIEQ